MRLQALMCSEPIKSPSRDANVNRPVGVNVADEKLGDLENGLEVTKSLPIEERLASADIRGIGFGQVINEIWHFMSVDYGHRC